MFKILAATLFITVTLWANEARIQDVQVSKQNGTYTFAVTILHEDSGWEHYVNKYEILDADGQVLATRKLWHPHEHEQPFTRSLSGVVLRGEKEVFVRANDSVNGYSKLFKVTVN